MRLLTFDRYLPFLDYGDETNMYLLGRDWRGVEEVPVVPEWLAGYPPLYVEVNIVVQQTVEAGWTRPWIFPSEYFYYTRLLAAIVGWLTTLVIMRLGWQLGGFIAAAFATGVWALSPFVVDYNSLAIPDPLVYLGCAIALVTAIQAWKTKSPLWLLGSLAAGIAVTYTKYPAFFALIPWALTTLALIKSSPRRWWRWLLVYGGIGLASAIYLIFGYGAFSLSNREADSVRNDLINVFNLTRQINNWYYAILPIGAIFFVVVVVSGSIAYIVSRKRAWQTLSWFPLLLILVSGLVGISITTTYTNIALPAGKIRHSLPITVGMVGFWAANISQIYWTLRDWRQSREAGHESWVQKAVIGGLGAIVGIWLLLGSLGSVQTFNLTHTEAVAQKYADASLPADGLFLMRALSRVEALFNPPWSGYSGSTAFRWWLEDDPTASTPERLAARGMTYFVQASDDLNNPNLRDARQAFTQQLTPLRTIGAEPGYVGPDITFYRILPPQVSVDVGFDDQILLKGYDLSSSRVHPGETLTLRPYWRAPNIPRIDYSMFVHVYPAAEIRVITQFDGTPALPTRPPVTWDDPDELIIGTDVSLVIPDSTPPGEYVLAIGLYDYASGQRLSTTDGDHFEIPIQIEG